MDFLTPTECFCSNDVGEVGTEIAGDVIGWMARLKYSQMVYGGRKQYREVGSNHDESQMEGPKRNISFVCVGSRHTGKGILLKVL